MPAGTVSLLRQSTHPLEARPVRIDIGDGAGRASRGTCWVAATEVALLDFATVVVGIDRPERAGDRLHFAAYAHGVHYHLGAGAGIDLDRLDGTSIETPGFGALRTGIGNFPAFVVEIENLDARWARLNRPVFSYEQAISHCK